MKAKHLVNFCLALLGGKQDRRKTQKRRMCSGSDGRCQKDERSQRNKVYPRWPLFQ